MAHADSTYVTFHQGFKLIFDSLDWLLTKCVTNYRPKKNCKYFKDVKKKHHQIKLQLTKSMDMDIWVVGTSNQSFIRGSLTEIKFFKKYSNY